MNYDPYQVDLKLPGIGCISLMLTVFIIACILSASVWFLVQ